MRANSIGPAIYRAIAPRGGFAGRAFRLEFTPFALSQTVPGAWPLLLLFWQGPSHLRVVFALLLALKIGVGGIVAAAIVSRCFPVIINEKGLRARNFWGQAREVAWDEIVRVAPIRWLFFTRFARLSTPTCRNLIWLPLFLREQGEFEDAVCQWASPTCALRAFFENDD